MSKPRIPKGLKLAACIEKAEGLTTCLADMIFGAASRLNSCMSDECCTERLMHAANQGNFADVGCEATMSATLIHTPILWHSLARQEPSAQFTSKIACRNITSDQLVLELSTLQDAREIQLWKEPFKRDIVVDRPGFAHCQSCSFVLHALLTSHCHSLRLRLRFQTELFSPTPCLATSSAYLPLLVNSAKKQKKALPNRRGAI